MLNYLYLSQKKIRNYSPPNQNRLIIPDCRQTILSTLFSTLRLPSPFIKHSRNLYPYLPHILKKNIVFISFHIRHVRALKKKKRLSHQYPNVILINHTYPSKKSISLSLFYRLVGHQWFYSFFSFYFFLSLSKK